METSARAFVLDAQGQEDLLKEALRNTRDQAFRMKRSMDTGELNGVLKHAAEVLRELRTSLLSPKNYYQLCASSSVLDELRHLESYVEDLHKSGTSIRSLYERVQSSGNVLPRLYLLVTVGSVYIKSKEAPAREVLTDLVEMTKGVQYPLRGLFLRNYLSICVKDKLPDVGSEYEGDGGTTEDAIAFLLQNFSETNRLWIRMQTQKAGAAASKDKAQREKERQDLRILIGTSLVRLSQMEGITLSVYSSQVLPKVLEIIVTCKDKIAQQYLMDCVIHVFPDEFHLQNFEKMLTTMGQLHAGVDVAAILLALLERLTKYHETMQGDSKTTSHPQLLSYGADVESAQKKQNEIFHLVLHRVLKLTLNGDVEALKTLASPLESIMALFAGFTTFTLKCFEATHRTTFLRDVMKCCLTFLQEQQQQFQDDANAKTTVYKYLKELLLHAMGELNLRDLMDVEFVSELLKLLPWKTTRKVVVLEWVQILLRRHEQVNSVDQVEFLTELLTPLIRDDPHDMPLPVEPLSTGTDRDDDFEMEQTNLSKVIHLMHCDDLDAKFQIFTVARRAFGQGGVFRIRFTLIPLIFQSLSLVRDLDNKKDRFKTLPREVLQFVHEMVTALASKLEQMSVTCVNLFLQCALVSDACGFEAIAYEFITQAFIVYEDQITHSKEQWKALELMVTSLRATRKLSNANYEVLATKTTQHAAKLLKKHEQAAMVLNLLAGLRPDLFILFPSQYLYFFEAKTPEVTQNYLNGLLALVKDHLENMEHGQTRSECEIRYRDILRYMDSKAIITSSSSGSFTVSS
uniref:Vacuolar protein sorting-associated protein 35 n=1 Tax=Globisporangium ultimum (strain ATCC 200006 / CBS 805.95 / DAOM BR144) TaxID=431595 RepID=K3XA29_GLOUD